MSHQTISRTDRITLVALVAALGFAPVVAPTLARASGGASATRTDKFTAPGAVTALALSNVNGEVRINAGGAFAATVVLTVRASDEARAKETLARTKVVFTFNDGKVTMRTEDPDKGDRGRRDDARVEARYEVTLPAAASVKANTVNGPVRIEGIAGALDADTVNGSVTVTGAGSSLELESVNGKVEATFTSLPPNAKVNARTVNGPVTLWVPANASLKLNAGFVNGELVSNLPLPVQTSGGFGPPPPYQGSIGSGAAADVRMNSVNGRLAVLRAGASADDAQPLIKRSGWGGWGSWGRGKGPPSPPRPPSPPSVGFHWQGGGHDSDDKDIRIDSVPGDFVVERAGADVRVDAIGGLARVRTVSGDVRIGSVAKSATLNTGGGDIRVKAVGGALEARTGGGDVRVDSVNGTARLETQGGDINLRGATGGVVALTRGGDIVLRGVKAGVKAETAGGDISLEMHGLDPGTGIELSTDGGDVSLVLPANFRAEVSIETRVHDGDDSAAKEYIESDFPELALTAAGGSFFAKGKLGGGGPKLVVRAVSGNVRVKKGPKI